MRHTLEDEEMLVFLVMHMGDGANTGSGDALDDSVSAAGLLGRHDHLERHSRFNLIPTRRNGVQRCSAGIACTFLDRHSPHSFIGQHKMVSFTLTWRLAPGWTSL